MRKTILSTLLALCAASALASPETEAVEKAQRAAQSWLAMADSGQYTATWDQAAKLFQSAISRSEWERTLAAVRDPVGKAENRVMTSVAYTRQLPGAPDGQYVVIHYQTQFSMQPNAVETVTPMMDADGNWRVSGYFIR